MQIRFVIKLRLGKTIAGGNEDSNVRGVSVTFCDLQKQVSLIKTCLNMILIPLYVLIDKKQMFLRNTCFSKSFSEKTQKPTTFKRLYRVTDVFLELFQTFYSSFSAEHPQDVASVQMHETQNRKVL